MKFFLQFSILIFSLLLAGPVFAQTSTNLPNGTACSSSLSCSSGNCVGGVCTPATCQVSGDCGTGQSCFGGVCVNNSSSNATNLPVGSPCVSSQSCASNNCVSNGSGSYCQTQSCDVNGDCSTNQSCVNNICVNNSSNSNGGSTNNSGSSGSNPICDTSNGYTMQNGLCIPNSPFSGGLASQSTLSSLIKTILNIILTLSGIIAVVFIIIGGFQYMTAGGNEEQSEKGRKALTNAIIGLVIVILSFTIVQVVTNAVTSSSPLGITNTSKL